MKKNKNYETTVSENCNLCYCANNLESTTCCMHLYIRLSRCQELQVRTQTQKKRQGGSRGSFNDLMTENKTYSPSKQAENPINRKHPLAHLSIHPGFLIGECFSFLNDHHIITFADVQYNVTVDVDLCGSPGRRHL